MIDRQGSEAPPHLQHMKPITDANVNPQLFDLSDFCQVTGTFLHRKWNISIAKVSQSVCKQTGWGQWEINRSFQDFTYHKVLLCDVGQRVSVGSVEVINS